MGCHVAGSEASLIHFRSPRIHHPSEILRFARNDIVTMLVAEHTFLGERHLHSVRAEITEIGTMAETYVPLISSGIAGPLGVLHLPRLWQKVSLEESGKLASGYPGIGHGFDAMTIAALGLEEQAVRDYIRQNKPTYPQFEAWVKQNAKSLNQDAIEKHNAAVRGYNHDDETRTKILGACKIADDASSPKDAVNLNNLDDWYEFHQAVLA